MKALYIIDASSLLAVKQICGNDEKRANDVFRFMFSLTTTDDLGFPACVPARCREFDDANIASVWALPTHSNMRVRSVPHSYQAEVLAVCPELLDEASDEDDQFQVELVAFAYSFAKADRDVVIVTEEVHSTPFREAIPIAAVALGMSSMTMADFMFEHLL